MEYNIKNILGNQKTNNEYYTPKQTVIDLIEKIKLPKNKIIWCPFDKGDSEFVIEFRKAGYKVIHSHIDNGEDFYTYTPNEHWDIIISNPPFSNKRLLIERCESFKKDFCLLYGCTIFSQSMGNTLNRCAFWFIQKNVKFISNTQTPKSFQCCWVTNKPSKLFQ